MTFKPHRIKYLLKDKGHTPISIARDYDFLPSEVSMCINGSRVYPEIRILISSLIGKSVDKVFGKHPLTTALLEEREAGQRNAA